MAATRSEHNAVVRPSLQTLPIEVLLNIVKASASAGAVDTPECRIEIPGYNLDFPPALPIARTNPAISSSILNWSYSTSYFSFVSQYNEMYANSARPQYAGEALLAWLHRIGEGNRRSIRKLGLALTAPELLLLFATAQSGPLLRLPRNMHVWAKCLALLKSLELNFLDVAILPGIGEDWACPLWSKHLEVDHRWVVKAVLDSMAHTPKCKLHFLTAGYEYISQAEVAAIKTISWNMLHSDTAGYRRSDKLAYPNERATGWACPDDVVTPYKIPVVPCRITKKQEVGDFLPAFSKIVPI